MPEIDRWGMVDPIALKAAKTGANFAEGSFSVFNWKRYPAGGIKPIGSFRLLEGAEYTSARNLANSTNAAMRKANPEMFKGNEQFNVVQPIYMKQSASTLSTLSKMAKGQGFFGIGVTEALRFTGDIKNPQDRFNHGAGKVTNFFNLQQIYWKLGW